MDPVGTLLVIGFLGILISLIAILIYSVSNGNQGVLDLINNRRLERARAEEDARRNARLNEFKKMILARDNYKCRICQQQNAYEIISMSGANPELDKPEVAITVCEDHKKELQEKYYHQLYKEQNTPLKEKVLERDNNLCQFCGGYATEVYKVHFRGRLELLDENAKGEPNENHISVCTNCLLDTITPVHFEEVVGRAFVKSGYVVKHTGGSGDQGIDLFCTSLSGTEKVIVQCKRYKGKVGVAIIRDFYGTLVNSGAHGGYVVTTGEFAEGAHEWAKGKKIELIDRSKIHRFLLEGPLFS